MKSIPLAAALTATLILPGRPSAAQSPGDKEVAPCRALTSEAPPCAAPASSPKIALLDAEPITQADLDEKTRKEVEGLDAAVAEARTTALEEEISEVLVALEAERRGTNVDRVLQTEVAGKVTAPTDAEIKASYDKNPGRHKGESLDEARPSIAAALRARREHERYAVFAGELKARFPVVLREDDVLATVGPRRITRASASDRLDAAVFFEVRLDVWRHEKKAVDRVVHERLLKREAEKRGVTPEALTKAEVEDRLKPPTDAEIGAYYAENRRWFEGELAAVKDQAAAAWTRDRKTALEEELDERLLTGHVVKLLFSRPEAPVLAVDASKAPARGDAKASVTLVEFGDFECPPCGMMYDRVEEALKPYGGKVRYAFRNLPMPFHLSAAKAAEAGLAAHEQGKFWPYADLLFRHQEALDVPSLKRYAAEAGLDTARFDAALDDGRFAAAVRADARDAARYGVRGTPTFFVNGVWLSYSDYDVKGIRRVLDAALAKASAPAR